MKNNITSSDKYLANNSSFITPNELHNHTIFSVFSEFFFFFLFFQNRDGDSKDPRNEACPHLHKFLF